MPAPPENLSLRPTIIASDKLENDFVVMQEERYVGRIRLAPERTHNPGWDWGITVPLPAPSWTHGSEDRLEEAKSAFREAWNLFYAGLTPDDIEHWHHHQEAAAERAK
jgi:hypothetical protein